MLDRSFGTKASMAVLMVAALLLAIGPAMADDRTGDALAYDIMLIGGSGTDMGESIVIDSAGNIYLGGQTYSIDLPTTEGPQYRPPSGFGYNYLIKMDPSGSPLFSTYMDGFIMDVDGLGNCYLVGSVVADTSSNDSYSAFHHDLMVLKLDAQGCLLAKKVIDCGGSSSGMGIAVGPDGSVYVGGSVDSSGLPVTVGCYDASYAGEQDGFVMKLSNDLNNILYCTYVGGTSWDYVSFIAPGPDGSIIFSGNTQSKDLPTSPGAYQSLAYLNNFMGFVGRINTSGSLDYLSFVGGQESGTGSTFIGDMAVDGRGCAYIVGKTDASAYPTTVGAYERTYNCQRYGPSQEGSMGFVTKVSPNGAYLEYSTFLGKGSEYCSCIVLDDGGEAFVGGRTACTDFPTTDGTHRDSFSQGTCGFLARISADGSALMFATLIDGFENAPADLALGKNMTLYVTGGVSSSTSAKAFMNGPVTGSPNAYLLCMNTSSAPLPPANFKAENKEGHVLLTWSDPVFDGGFDITGYVLYRNGVELVTVLGNSYEDADVAYNQTYFYTIRSINELGLSQNSSEVSLVTIMPSDTPPSGTPPYWLVGVGAIAAAGCGAAVITLWRRRR